MKSRCTKSGKVQFLTENTADMWIRNQNDKHSKRKGFKPLSRAYQCKYCGLWHTTTKEAK